MYILNKTTAFENELETFQIALKIEICLKFPFLVFCLSQFVLKFVVEKQHNVICVLY